MSIQAVGWAFEQDLPAGPKIVLLSLANHADHTDGYCFLKGATIAREANCKPRSVWRYLGALIRNGYVRKARRQATDGRRRANDYWLLFARPAEPWDWGAKGPADEPDDDGDESGTDLEPQEPTPQDLVQPYANLAHGDSAAKSRSIPSESHGPCAIGVTWKSPSEPSESKPRDSSCVSPQFAEAPRSYRPPAPPPEPTEAEKGQRQFVIADTPAWKEWLKHKQVASLPTTTAQVHGKTCVGWYFPSLFPPKAPVETKQSSEEERETR